MPRCKRCESANLACEYTPARRKFTNVRFQNQTSPPINDVATPAPGSRHSEEKSMSPSLGSRVGLDAALATVESLTAEYVLPLKPVLQISWFDQIANKSTLNREMLNKRDFLLRCLEVYFDVYFWMPCMGFLHPKVAYQEVQVNIPARLKPRPSLVQALLMWISSSRI